MALQDDIDAYCELLAKHLCKGEFDSEEAKARSRKLHEIGSRLGQNDDDPGIVAVYKFYMEIRQ